LTQKPDQLHLTDDEGAAWEGFLRAHATIMRALSGELEQVGGMSMSSYDVLIQLARAPKRRLRMTELAEAVVLSSSGLTRLVERLEREGLVARIKSADDARGAYATLTDLGRARLRKATRSHLTGIRQHFLSQITPEELQMLGNIWQRLLTQHAPDLPPQRTTDHQAPPSRDI
jgi:DNA-binding MarR family transcriptional regulator